MNLKQGKPVLTPIIREVMVNGMQNAWKKLPGTISIIQMEILQTEEKSIAEAHPHRAQECHRPPVREALRDGRRQARDRAGSI